MTKFRHLVFLCFWMISLLGYGVYGFVQAGEVDTIQSRSWHPTISDGIALGYHDGSIRIWDLTTNTVLTTFHEQTREIYHLAWSPDGSLLASASFDSSIKIWNTVTRSPTSIVTISLTPGDPLGIVAFNNDGTRLYTGTSGTWNTDTFRVWNTLNGSLVSGIEAGEVSDIALSPSGNYLAVSNSFRVAVWSVNPLEQITNYETVEIVENTNEIVVSSRWSANSEYFVSGHRNGVVRLWRFQNNTLELVFERQGNDQTEVSSDLSSVRDVYINSQNLEITSVSADGTVRTWDINGNLLLDAHIGEPVRGAAFSIDGTLGFTTYDSADVLSVASISELFVCDFDISASDTTALITVISNTNGTRQHTGNGAQVMWTLPLNSTLSSNLSAITLADGRLALAAGTNDNRLRVWMPGG